MPFPKGEDNVGSVVRILEPNAPPGCAGRLGGFQTFEAASMLFARLAVNLSEIGGDRTR
jgi:hypothetical protein